MGCTGHIPDARPNNIGIVIDNTYVIKEQRTNNESSSFVLCSLVYTINGRFSSVPSATRTFTSISINSVSGVLTMFGSNMWVDNM